MFALEVMGENYDEIQREYKEKLRREELERKLESSSPRQKVLNYIFGMFLYYMDQVVFGWDLIMFLALLAEMLLVPFTYGITMIIKLSVGCVTGSKLLYSILDQLKLF